MDSANFDALEERARQKLSPGAYAFAAGGADDEITLADNLAFFGAAEVTVGPVYDASELPQDVHVRERAILVELPDADLGRLPMHNVSPRLSRSPGAIRTPAPTIGQHNAEIYGSLGFDMQTLSELSEAGTI